jgi:hypothetical protein
VYLMRPDRAAVGSDPGGGGILEGEGGLMWEDSRAQ